MHRREHSGIGDRVRPEAGEAAPGETPRITQAMEDYLKSVYRLQTADGSVSTQRLAEDLRISGPSVTNMVKRLHDLCLVEYAPYHGVRLTPSGQKIALEVIRHHRLLELYLAQTLGYQWDEVHAEAERLEHHVSDELEERMDSALGHPTRDPHGDPIPSRDGEIAAVSPTLLLDLPLHRTAVVARVSDRDAELLRYLGELGVRPGSTIVVVVRSTSGGPLKARIAGKTYELSYRMAAAVHVGSSQVP
jgi:DtxR family Mn-dependent transcriptional regulator